MTDKELIQELRDKAAVEGSGSTRRLLELAARALERVQWVSVKNRVPDKDGHVLTYSSDSKMIDLLYYSTKHMAFNCQFSADTAIAVSYWMPLPEPPEEVTGDA